MALTRTRFISADTSAAKLEDPITLLNSNATVANVDVGFLINRSLGLNPNVAIVWNESGNSFVVAFTNDTGITNSNLNISTYANVTAGTIIVNSLKTDNFLYSNGNPFSAPASDYAQTFVADNLSSGNAVFATTRITGNLQVEGNIFTIGQQNLSISDAVIDLHTQANLAPWTFNDGKDIGLKFHYYDYQDEHAFLGRTNNSGYLEWYDSGREIGNVFTGNTHGTIKSGELVVANATVSSNTITGALRVSGGVGIAGRLNVGGNIVADSGTASSSTTTGAMIVRGGIGVSGDAYVGGALTAGGLQNTPIGTVTPNSGFFNDLNNTLTLKSGGNIVAYSATSSTSTTTGALVVVGGAGISGAVNTGSTIRASGNIVAASGTASSDTTTGALVVVGGAGVSGNIYSDSLYTSGLYWANNNQSITGPATGTNGSLQFNNSGVVGGTNAIYDSVTGNIVFTNVTNSTSTTTGAVVLLGGLGVTGNIFAGGLNGTIYGSLFIGTTDVNLNRSSAAQVLTGVGISGTAGTATNAINTQVTSNISSGTAYVTFVNATSGNVAQNINTSLTYNPNSGNLRAYGVLTDTGVYWAGNGAAFSSSPGGTTGQIQFNNASTFSGANIIFNSTNGNLVITSTTTSTSTTTGALVVAGGAGISGAINAGSFNKLTITAPATSATLTIANGKTLTASNTLTFTGTDSSSVAFGTGGTVAYTANKLSVFAATTSAELAGVISDETGSGALVFATSPALVTPALGTPSSGTLTSCTGLPIVGGTTGTLSVARGGTGVTTSTGSGAVVLGTSPTFTTQITTPVIAKSGTNAVGNIGQADNRFNTVFATATSALYADLAENYTADQDYAPGTVVVFGGEKEVTTTTITHDTRVAGVISTNPGYLMNAGSEGLPVAFTGRVPCQVRGPVSKGTVLVTSNTPGVAEALVNSLFRPGCVLGKSLEDIATDDVKTIEVVVGRF
jgi:hypothetical protein